MKRVAVLTGGSSPERDVAFAGAGQVAQALRERGYRVDVVDTVNGPLSESDEERIFGPGVGRTPPTVEQLRALAARERPQELILLPEVREADVLFLVLHGKQGEGGEIQALLELVDVPYTGSDVLGSALAMDKDVAKRLLRAAEVPTPAWFMWPVDEEVSTSLGFPVVVKPSNVGSSVGLSVVASPAGLDDAVRSAQVYDDDVMLERYVDGREFTVGVLGDRALAVGEIIPEHETFDYECKYTPGMAREVFPAEIPDALTAEIRRLALAAHQALKLRDFSRTDFRLDPDDVPQCLEVNTLPGLTATSLLPQSAAAAAIPFSDLCEAICEAAMCRSPTKEQSEHPHE
jgi:D-alanine-D-alanine ligase